MKINILLLTVILCFSACTFRPKGVMSKQQMIDFLTDYHKLEGSLQAGDYYSDDKKKPYYEALFAEYRISKLEFDSSLVYYTARPKLFEKIYASVVENLTLFEKDIKSLKFHPLDSVALRNSEEILWQIDTIKGIISDSLQNRLKISVNTGSLLWKDIYRLKFLHRIDKHDFTDSIQNRNTLFIAAVLKIYYRNGEIDSLIYPLKTDGKTRRVSLILPAKRQSRIDSITTNLLNFAETKDSLKLYFDSVRLIRRYDFFEQDTLRKQVLTADTLQRDTVKMLQTEVPKIQKMINDKIYH